LLLALTVLMGGALIASSVFGFLLARRDAATVARAAGRQMAHTVMRDLMRSRGQLRTALDWAVAELEEEGLRYAAVCTPEGACDPSVGEPLATDQEAVLPPIPAPRERWQPPRALLEPRPIAGAERMRVVRPLWLDPDSPRPPRFRHRPMREWGRGMPAPSKLLVLEYEPRAAQAIHGRAVRSLAIGLGASGLLLAVTGIVWRLSRRAERYEQQLARDRELKKLGEVSAVLGHQLRNPLASLKGHSQLLLEELPEESPARRGAETIVSEAARLEVLTNQILDFVRTGNVDRRSEAPAELLRAVAERWPVDRVAVDASRAPAEWPLDRARMEQAVGNVVDNAVAVSPPGETVELAAEERQGRLLLRVRDRGPGLDPEEAERIFEPFYTQRLHGTGLGLALSRRIVEGHGGTIAAFPRDGGGTEIRIELPRG
jgi:two-component system sensor histidine kinase HydH